jgi:hypothetical protein
MVKMEFLRLSKFYINEYFFGKHTLRDFQFNAQRFSMASFLFNFLLSYIFMLSSVIIAAHKKLSHK